MGILDSLKGMVGKGSPKVEVKLLKEQATVQESVKGVATFTGGEYPVTIDSVILLMLMVEDIKEKQTTKESKYPVTGCTVCNSSLILVYGDSQTLVPWQQKMSDLHIS